MRQWQGDMKISHIWPNNQSNSQINQDRHLGHLIRFYLAPGEGFEPTTN